MPQQFWDTVFGAQERISDKEAAALYDLWKSSPAGKLVPSATPPDTVMALKMKGYVRGFGDSLELTSSGQRLIREMATHEPNSFEKNAKTPPYSKIRDKKASRPRQTHVAKQSKQASLNEARPFNLRRESLRRMGLCE
jgi:hypothetical protein